MSMNFPSFIETEQCRGITIKKFLIFPLNNKYGIPYFCLFLMFSFKKTCLQKFLSWEEWSTSYCSTHFSTNSFLLSKLSRIVCNFCDKCYCFWEAFQSRIHCSKSHKQCGVTILKVNLDSALTNYWLKIHGKIGGDGRIQTCNLWIQISIHIQQCLLSHYGYNCWLRQKLGRSRN